MNNQYDVTNCSKNRFTNLMRPNANCNYRRSNYRQNSYFTQNSIPTFNYNNVRNNFTLSSANTESSNSKYDFKHGAKKSRNCPPLFASNALCVK